MHLTPEEKDILAGKQGDVLQKLTETIVRYGDIFDADRLVPLSHSSHLVTSFGIPLLKPAYMMTDQLIESGLKSDLPFTADPRPHADTKKLYNPLVRLAFNLMFEKQKKYEDQLLKLGLKNENAYSCTCYHDEVGNIPASGDILAWAESSAVVYANSVLGARTNRNSAFIELFCAILGKAPNFGLLTDEGRMADWVIELKMDSLPPAQLLGGAIGQTVVEDVPYIKGLDAHLGNELTPDVKDYLKDLGAASASNGAVGLFHVGNLTPEAKEQGENLIKPGAKGLTVTYDDLDRIRRSYPVLWKNKDATPEFCYIGCPHLSYQQLVRWATNIMTALQKLKRKKILVKTALTAAPDVITRFETENRSLAGSLKQSGVVVSTFCPLANLNNPLLTRKAVLTNSNKLRTYTRARYFENNEILSYITTGGPGV
ncbi:MAG: aconitase X catalytic domain-containing protein [Proteobacteria bacterium]|nr:aconitase X catalytic domain-containing protein [Pseudomonadota bacterium]